MSPLIPLLEFNHRCKAHGLCPGNPRQTGRGLFEISTKGIILSIVVTGQAVFSCRLALWQVLLLLPSVGPRVGKSMSSAPLLACFFQRLARAKALVLAGS
jgi:hypothetical protein